MLPAGSEGLLPLVLRGVLRPDISTDDHRPPLRMTHRRIDDHDIYFVINDSPKAWQGRVRFAATGQTEFWDPATGKATILPAGQPVSLSLDAYLAALPCFSGPPPPRHPLKTGPMPNLKLKPLPFTSPVLGHGEFAVAELTGRRIGRQCGTTAVRRVFPLDGIEG